MQNIRFYVISCFFFLSSEFIDSVLVTFVDIVFVILVAFVDTLSAAFTIFSHVITESSITHAKYLPFPQIHVQGLRI